MSQAHCEQQLFLVKEKNSRTVYDDVDDVGDDDVTIKTI